MFVGMFTSVWHDLEPTTTRRVQGIDSYTSGPGTFWWGKPKWPINEYTWNNKDMVDYHIDNLIELDVDFIFLDFTNGTQGPILDGAHKLCQRLEQRGDGPQVVFWIQVKEDAPLFHQQFYSKYSKTIFFEYLGKPLLLMNGLWDKWAPAPGRVKPIPTGGVLDAFTVRWCWGLLGPAMNTMWSFKDVITDLQPYTFNGEAEQLGLAFSSQATYMTDPKQRRCRDNGAFFNEQIPSVKKHKPKFVTIVGYNEWTTGNLNPVGSSVPKFTDLFGSNCSHDIEPMQGGHGRKYFDMTKEFIRKLRSGSL